MYELKDKSGRSLGRNFVTSASATAVAVGLKLEEGYTIKFQWGKDDERAGGRDLPPMGEARP